jgi:uncharacterized protein
MINKPIQFAGVIPDIVAILIVVLLPHFALVPIPFYYIVPVLALIWLYLKRTKENFTSLGFAFKRFEYRSVIVGAVTAILLFACMQYIFFPVLSHLMPLKPANLDDFKSVRGNTSRYIFILAAGFIVGGVYEEIVFHGFIFTRIEKSIGGRSALPVSFLVTNLVFGLYHFQLGVSGMIDAFIAGLIYHALMIKFNRNLWYSIFAHAFFDAIGLTYIYLGYW